MPKRVITYVSGSRADFGLMTKTFYAIEKHPLLKLKLIVTGSHLDASRGKTLNDICAAGINPDLVIPWKDDGTPSSIADQTLLAARKIANAHVIFKTDVALILGDRVEAFAAAAAAQLLQLPVAHVHGGDRAQGQADDTLRHAITKLSHLHFTASPQSTRRVIALGEEPRRVFCVGAPGLEGISLDATSRKKLVMDYPVAVSGRFILFLQHPDTPDVAAQYKAARMVLRSLLASSDLPLIVMMPNHDAGAGGIVSAIRSISSPRVTSIAHAQRADFLGLLRDCAFLAGNSSAGIIEAASFGTPVLDIGPRQFGREYGENVQRIPVSSEEIKHAVRKLLRPGGISHVRYPRKNIYSRPGTASKISELLAKTSLTPDFIRKIITF